MTDTLAVMDAPAPMYFCTSMDNFASRTFFAGRSTTTTRPILSIFSNRTLAANALERKLNTLCDQRGRLAVRDITLNATSVTVTLTDAALWATWNGQITSIIAEFLLRSKACKTQIASGQAVDLTAELASNLLSESDTHLSAAELYSSQLEQMLEVWRNPSEETPSQD